MQKPACAILTMLMLIASAALSGCTGIPDLEATEEFNRTVTVEPGSEVVVINRNGGVTVDVREGETVTVSAVKRSAYGQTELDKVQIVVTEGDPLRIETVHTAQDPQVNVDCTIHLPPATVLLRAESSNGPIDLAGARVNGTAFDLKRPHTGRRRSRRRYYSRLLKRADRGSGSRWLRHRKDQQWPYHGGGVRWGHGTPDIQRPDHRKHPGRPG